ncbi:MAG: glycosyltransferase [Anaerolineales bacterium]|nr:glycosyltransferase [Anaerolineales bacterium]
MNSPSVSILMPVRNAANTLRETLGSIQSQTLTDFELIAVNDGSEDDTSNILHTYSTNDKRIKAVDMVNGGIIKALNHGLALSQSNFIARMDADDLIHPKRLEMQLQHLLDNPGLSITSCLAQPFPHNSYNKGFHRYVDWLNSLTTNLEIARDIFVESPVPHPSVMLRKEELQSLGRYQDHGWAEDYDLWLRYFIAGKQIGKIPKVLLYWRDHPSRTSRTDSRYSVENFIKAKVYYLLRGPLLNRDTIIIWGAGQMGKRISNHLIRSESPVNSFLDINPRKIGQTLRGRPIYSANHLPTLWQQSARPVVLVSVGSHGARSLIRNKMQNWGFNETEDYWCVA